MVLAYIDPGSGSIILQVLLASCIGGLAMFWSKLKTLFGGKQPAEPEATEPKADGDAPFKPE